MKKLFNLLKKIPFLSSGIPKNCLKLVLYIGNVSIMKLSINTILLVSQSKQKEPAFTFRLRSSNIWVLFQIQEQESKMTLVNIIIKLINYNLYQEAFKISFFKIHPRVCTWFLIFLWEMIYFNEFKFLKHPIGLHPIFYYYLIKEFIFFCRL